MVMATRKQYYTQIYIYKKRREDYRNRYKGEVAIYKTERYKELTKRISQWQKEIKRLDIRKAKIAGLLNSVNKYFNVKVQDRSRNDKVDMARKIFFKTGLELKICGTHLARFIGRKHCDTASNGRRSLMNGSLVEFHKFQNWLSINSKT